MSFDSRRAASEGSSYYDEYEAIAAANLARSRSIASTVWGDLSKVPPVTFNDLSNGINALTENTDWKLSRLPYSHRLVKAQRIIEVVEDDALEEYEQLGHDNLGEYESIELTAYRALKLGKSAPLIGATILAVIDNNSGVDARWDLRFDGEPRITGASAQNNMCAPLNVSAGALPAIHLTLDALQTVQSFR